MNIKAIGLAGIGICMLAAPSFAHHADMNLDFEQTVEVSGTVTEFFWASPHSSIEVSVAGDAGASADWSLDLDSPGKLARAGWTPTTLAAGDEVTAIVHPLKDGSPGGQIVTIVLPDGTVMGE